MNANRSLLTTFVVVGVLSHAGPARAAPSSDAETLFQEGRAALADEDYEAARSHFEQSYKIDPALGTLLNLAVCEEKLGKLRSALAHLQEAIDKAQADDKRRPLISQRLSRLETRVPRLIVRLSRPLPPGVTLSLDAAPLDVGDVGKTLRVDPGTHVLDCAGPNGERCTIVFTLAEGQESVQVPTLSAPSPVPVVASSPARSPPPPAPVRKVERGAEKRSFAYAAGGFGLASVAVGLIAGASVLEQKRLVDQHCDDQGCDAEGLAAGERGKTLSMVSTIATGVGVVIIGASVYLLVTTPSSTNSATGVTLAGSF